VTIFYVARDPPCSPSEASLLRTMPGQARAVCHLATAFPRPVWLDHLLPLLTLGGTLTLRATCKAMRAIVADMPADLGERPVQHLRDILACFPTAVTLELYEEPSMTEAERDSLIAWLDGRATGLACIQRECSVEPLVRRAWRAGVCKAVKHVRLDY
jgi:hypothetical protein